MNNENYQDSIEDAMRKLKWLVHQESDVTFTPLDVMALLHYIEPKSIGWDFTFGLASRADVNRSEAEQSLDKLRRLTMSIPSKHKAKARMARRPESNLSYFESIPDQTTAESQSLDSMLEDF